MEHDDKYIPNQPQSIMPEDNTTDEPINATLYATPFASRDLKNTKEAASANRNQRKTQKAAQWQIRLSTGDYESPVWDGIIEPGDPSFHTSDKLILSNKLNEVTIPHGVLKPLTSYHWRVKYQASDDLWSEWSEETQFVTSPFTIQPYLQNLTQTGVVVMWEDDKQNGYVEYGADNSYGYKSISTTIKTEANTFIHKAIINDLSPETIYHYRVFCGSHSSLDTAFRTAPHRDTPFTFSIWADSQTGPQVFETLLEGMISNRIDFGVAVGDMATNGDIYDHVHNYHVGPLSKKFGGKLPWFLTWGGHDGKDRIIYDYVSLPKRSGTYSFDYGNSHFAFLSIHELNEESVKWLKADLASPEAQNAAFRFFFVHNPPYCIIWLDGDEWLRQNVVPLLEEYNVDFVFSGHTHDYERGHYNGVYYVVTGGGSWLDYHEPTVGDWDFLKDHLVMDNEFILISIDGNELDYNAINDEGEIIDSIRIEK